MPKKWSKEAAQRIAREVWQREREAKRPLLPDYALADVRAGKFTVAELFTSGAISGAPGDYNLSEFTSAQLG